MPGMASATCPHVVHGLEQATGSSAGNSSPQGGLCAGDEPMSSRASPGSAWAEEGPPDQEHPGRDLKSGEESYGMESKGQGGASS